MPEPLAAKLANGPKVAQLAARYMAEHVAVRCKANTERTFRSLLDRHVLPALGKVPVAAVGREEALAFHEGLAGLPTTANMAVKMLSHMFAMAESWGLVAQGTNPWRFVTRYPAPTPGTVFSPTRNTSGWAGCWRTPRTVRAAAALRHPPSRRCVC